MTTRAAALPPNLPPRFLSRDQAAAYLGVSARLFDREVAAGLWPRPMRRGDRDARLTWDRLLLDLAADRHAGIVQPQAAGGAPHGAPAPDLAALEQAALEACDVPHPHRHKERRPSRA